MEDILNRLKRIEGQIRGLQKIVAAGEDCDKFLTQLNAAKGALERIGMIVIANDMRRCVSEKAGPDGQMSEALDETITMFFRHINSLKS